MDSEEKGRWLAMQSERASLRWEKQAARGASGSKGGWKKVHRLRSSEDERNDHFAMYWRRICCTKKCTTVQEENRKFVTSCYARRNFLVPPNRFCLVFGT